MKDTIIGFLLCLVLILTLGMKPWESVFDKFGPLLLKAIVRAEVAEFNRNRDWHGKPPITATNVYNEVMGYVIEYENE